MLRTGCGARIWMVVRILAMPFSMTLAPPGEPGTTPGSMPVLSS